MKKLSLTLCAMMVCASSQAAVVLVGNPAATELSAGQASKLYLGKLKSLPWTSGKPMLIELPDGDPLRVEFHDKVTGKSEAQVRSYWMRLVFTGKAQPPVELMTTKQVKEVVASEPNAVGYIDSAEVDASVKVLLKP